MKPKLGSCEPTITGTIVFVYTEFDWEPSIERQPYDGFGLLFLCVQGEPPPTCCQFQRSIVFVIPPCPGAQELNVMRYSDSRPEEVVVNG